VAGRHPDVDDDQLGLVPAHERQQLGCVARLPDDLEPRPRQEAGQPFAQEDVVVGERHPGGGGRGPGVAGA
jgi:hypothetical protein